MSSAANSHVIWAKELSSTRPHSPQSLWLNFGVKNLITRDRIASLSRVPMRRHFSTHYTIHLLLRFSRVTEWSRFSVCLAQCTLLLACKQPLPLPPYHPLFNESALDKSQNYLLLPLGVALLPFQMQIFNSTCLQYSNIKGHTNIFELLKNISEFN